MIPYGERRGASMVSSAPSTPTRTTSTLPPRFTDQQRPGSPAPSLSHGPGAGGDVAWYESALKKLGKQPEWPLDKEEALLEPYTYLSSVPGKEVRSALIDAFNHWLRVPQPQLDSIKRVVRMLHTASLLMDDVEDNSTLRRGVPVAHKIYGIPQTINTANYVYFQVFDEIYAMGGSSSSLSSPEHPLGAAPSSSTAHIASATARSLAVARVVTSELLHLHRGQGMDLLWRDSLTCPTEEEYVEMVNNKTGGLFRIALGLMCAWSPLFNTDLATAHSAAAGEEAAPAASDPPPDRGLRPDLDLVPLANLIGLLFQIRDDYMNLNSETYADNKGFAEDLTEGKFSFPIIHAIRSAAVPSSSPFTHSVAAASTSASASPSAPQPTQRGVQVPVPPNRQLLNILSQRPTDPAIKAYAVRQMRTETRSFVYTRSVLRVLDMQARAEVAHMELEVAKRWKAQQGGGNPTSEEVTSAANPGLRAILDALRKGWWEDLDKEL